MKQKILTLLFLAFIPIAMMAYDYEVDGIFYNLNNNAKTAEVTYESSTSYPYSGEVVIPSSILYNGITYSVTRIGSFAFEDCTGLTAITIPSGVKIIGDHAFYECSGLTSINIPSGVTSIGEYAFYDCSSLTDIVIPNSMTFIGESAFCRCSSLTSINIPNSVTRIESWTFNNTGLTEIEIPNSVTSIGSYALYDCPDLTSVTIHSNLTRINEATFGWCPNLTTINIPNGVTSIGTQAFENCSSLPAITIPSSVTSIGERAFALCGSLEYFTVENPTPITIPSNVFENSVTNTLYVPYGTVPAYTAAEVWKGFNSILVNLDQPITFADNAVKTLCVDNWDTSHDGELSIAEAAAVTDLGTVFEDHSEITSFAELRYFAGLTSIGNLAFYYCSKLTTIEIPYTVTSIGDIAFFNCTSLTALTIPKNVTSIGRNAFSICNGLTAITVDPENTKYDSRNNCNAIIEKSSNQLIVGCKNSIIPNGVTSIGEEAFYGCAYLTAIEIPSSVTSIKKYAFLFCEGLTSINIPNSVTSIEERAFSNCHSLKTFTIPNSVTSIEGFVFERCDGLKTINIPNSVTSIGFGAFYECNSLTTINIPNSVTSIGTSAFYNCSSLNSITIPNSVTSIGSDAFNGCSNLTSVTVENPTPIYIGYNVFSNRANATLYVPYGTKEAYEAADVWKDFGNIIEVVIPTQPIIFADAYVKSLCVDNWDTNHDGELSFAEAAAVTNLSNNGVRVFADEQISLFDELQFFTGLTSIGEYDFSDCSALMSITIPNSVTSIGQYAFSGCCDMTSISIPNSVTSIGEHAFSYCDGLTSITIPESVTSIGSSAFYECGGLTFITIPKKVTSIGEYAFFGCSDLTAVTVENPSPLTISANTFSNYDYASLYVPSGKKAAYEATEVWQDFGRIVPVVNVVENGNLEGEPSNDWSSFWVREWRTMEEPFLGPANIVADPTNISNHCIKVVVRSEAEAREAGNMIDDGNGNYAPYESVFFVQSKQKFESGKVLRLTMRVKADREAVIQTQAHQTPDIYQYWQLFGDIEVTDTWQTVVKEIDLTPEITQESNSQGMRTVAFLLATVPEGNVFYFDDIKLEYESSIQKGDLNNDGQVDIYDVTALIDIILEGDTTPPYKMTQYDHVAADMNNDSSIDIYDVTLLIDTILDKK